MATVATSPSGVFIFLHTGVSCGNCTGPWRVHLSLSLAQLLDYQLFSLCTALILVDCAHSVRPCVFVDYSRTPSVSTFMTHLHHWQLQTAVPMPLQLPYLRVSCSIMDVCSHPQVLPGFCCILQVRRVHLLGFVQWLLRPLHVLAAAAKCVPGMAIKIDCARRAYAFCAAAWLKCFA